MADETTGTRSASNDVQDGRNSAKRRSGSSDPKTSDETSRQPEAAVNDELGEARTDEGAGATELEPRPTEDEVVVEEEVEEEEEEAVRRKSSSMELKKWNRRRTGKGLVLEYDLTDMYPEMSLLAQNTKKEWNYHDPEIIRAIWLESRTNALTEWKYKHTSIIKKKKPDLQVQMNHAVQLRHEFMERKKERVKDKIQRQLATLAIGRDAPDFQELKLPTTTTAEMRYKFNRDNPPVPKYYLHHFEKYKKPPFKTKVSSGIGCKPNTMQSG